MNIAIIGFDTDGRDSYDYFSRQGHEISIRDQDAAKPVPDGVNHVLGDNYLNDLDQYDLIVRTSGMHPRKILDRYPGLRDKVTTGVNEFCKLSPTRNIIGVTGTKGKGTTSTLIANMLQAAGKTVYIGGNIGTPPLSFIDQLDAGSWVVLELSSFQLIDFTQAPHIAVCLMVVPEHLDWHADLEEYYTAKEQLFARQGTADVAVYFHDNTVSKRIAGAGQAQKVPFYHSPGAEVVDGRIVIDGVEVCRTDELKLLGQHNWQNACAAVTAAWYAALEVCGPSEKPDVTAMHQALTSFSGLEYRLQFERELDGIKYYNDSFGTTPEAAIVALQAFTQPKVVILGGSDKGASYQDLARAVRDSNVRSALLIGSQASRIQQALEKVGFTDFEPGGTSMPQIVAKARSLARHGDVILLSTGCASLDMFQNYKDRGQQFTQAVKDLA